MDAGALEQIRSMMNREWIFRLYMSYLPKDGNQAADFLAKKEIQASLFSPVLSQAYPGLETIFYMGWEQYFIYGLEMRVHVCYEKYSPIEFFLGREPNRD